jgi:hypothetical protein
VAVHPEQHRGDEDHGDRADHGLERLLLRLRQRGLEQPEGDADGDADPDREPHAEPHRAETAAVAAEERGDDADDQRGLEAFAQADHQGGEHGFLPRVGERRARARRPGRLACP